MRLRGYLRLLRRRWRVILSLLLVSIACGILYVRLTPEEYQGSAQLFVSTSTADSTQALAQGNSFAEARVQTYTDAANSPTIAAAVIADLELNLTENQLAAKISADAPLNKVLINIHVSDGSPTEAARLTNAVANEFAKYVEKLETTDQDQASPVKLTVIHPAQVPAAPISPNVTLDLAIAILVGVVLGVGLGALREALDTSVKDAKHLTEVVSIPALAVIPLDKLTPDVPMAFKADPHGGRAESYRTLRSNLQFVNVDEPPRIVAVTSGSPAEGKSTSALNLAAAVAETGQRVCLIEADLRRPSIGKALGLVESVGLTTVLIGKAAVEDVIQNAGRNLAILSSGPVPPNPSELLVSQAFRDVLDYVAERVDLVVIDTPPLLSIADGADVCAVADATLLVVREGKTKIDQIQRAVDILTNVGVTPVGTIMTFSKAARRSSYDYYYYSSATAESSNKAEMAESPAQEDVIVR